MDVSIIIPFYLRQAELEALLVCLADSVPARFKIETLIVEDGSPVAKKPQLEKQYQHLNLRFILNKRNMGPSFTRNRGAEEASGKYLWFMDTDTSIMRPDTLEALVDVLEKDPTILATGGVIEEVDGKNYIMRPVVLPAFHYVYEKVEFQEDYQEYIPSFGTNFFIAKSKFFAVGGFDVTLNIAEDHDLCMRLHKMLGGKFFQSTKTLIRHNVSDSGRDSGSLGYFANQWAYMHVKFKVRNILLRRYKPWKLALLPVMELVSILKFLIGFKSGRWHLSRTAKVKSGLLFIDLSHSAFILATYCIAGMGVFFLPENCGKRLSECSTHGMAKKI